MIKAKDMIGRRLVAASNGELVAHVKDLVFDAHGTRLLAFLSDEGGWFRGAKVVPFMRVKSFGDDAIMIDAPSSLIKASDDATIEAALDNKTTLVGLELLSESGEKLGRIADIALDPATGMVAGFEASAGIFADIARGRSWLPLPDNLRLSKDAAVVPNAAAARMQSQAAAGGLQGAFDSAASRVGSAVDTAGARVGAVLDATRDKASAAVDDARSGATQLGEKAGGAFDKLKHDAAALAAEAREQGAHALDTLKDKAGDLGARAESALEHARTQAREGLETVREQAREGLDVAREKTAAGLAAARGTAEDLAGRTREVAEDLADRTKDVAGDLADRTRARADALGHKAGEVLQDAGEALHDARVEAGEKFDAARDQAGHAWTDAQHTGTDKGRQASAAVAAGAATLTAAAGTAFAKAKSWIGERKTEIEGKLDERAQAAQEQAIRHALGRPVNRAILAPDDSVLLPAGGLVTNRVVAQAREHGVLDLVLTSVDPDANLAGYAQTPADPSNPEWRGPKG